MSVGLLAVLLKYGLYVGHLSKWFVFVNSFMFLVVCLWSHCRLLGLLITYLFVQVYSPKLTESRCICVGLWVEIWG